MKMIELIELSAFFTKIQNRNMPIQTVYKFTKLKQEVEREATFYQEQFTRIIEDYGQKDENGYVFMNDGATIAIIPGKEQECKQKISDLQNLEVDIKYTFSLDELSGLSLTISEFQPILSLITE